MKAFVVAVLLTGALVAGRPEPPSNQYLFPGYSTTHQDRFSPPAQQSDYSSNSISVESARSQHSAPSNQYSAPSNQYSAPSNQYSAPSNQYSAPSNQYSAPSNQYSAPSNQYLAPRSQHSAPSNEYGAPSRSSSAQQSQQSSRGHSGSSARNHASPARSYGAPAQTAAVFHSAQPSAAYNAPSASYAAPAPAQAYGAPSAGYAYAKNTVDDDLSEPANYEFSYDVMDAPQGGEFAHRESRNGDVTWGSYEVLLPDGRKQIVEYEADAQGYRPKIRYEEPKGGYQYSAGNSAGGPY